MLAQPTQAAGLAGGKTQEDGSRLRLDWGVSGLKLSACLEQSAHEQLT